MFIQTNKKLHVLLFLPEKIPAIKYGGTERVVWDLAKALRQLNYKVTFLVKEGSACDFANILYYRSEVDINSQIPDDVDIVHCHAVPNEKISKPYLITIHGNPSFGDILDKQCVFVSQNHANRYQSNCFVHNGLNWDNYQRPVLNSKRNYFHFLANASWKVKNLKGAIAISKIAKQKLVVLGGNRLNLKMGPRFTFDTHVTFKGMLDNYKKSQYLQQSKGLIFPVLWHEPFGLAIIESLYFGCPVFATPYGSLPELIPKEVGFLSNQLTELANALLVGEFKNEICHQYAQDNFSANNMCYNYLLMYDKVLNGTELNNNNPSLIKKKESKYLPFQY